MKFTGISIILFSKSMFVYYVSNGMLNSTHFYAFINIFCYSCFWSILQILLYDLRSSRPLLVKDHNFCLPIKDIEFHRLQNLVLSCDSRILKIWDEHSVWVKNLTSYIIEICMEIFQQYFRRYLWETPRVCKRSVWDTCGKRNK